MSSASVPLDSQGRERLAWIDQLRTMAIVLVVNMHTCVTYSHVGSWYVTERPDPPLVTKIAFLFWQGHLQAFFMGILFLLGGYFAHGSLRRRGTAGFLRERLMRLGAPTLLYMAVLHPLIIFVINPWGSDHGPLPAAYLGYLLSGRFLSGTGPMWFAAALLLFSAALAGWRLIRPGTDANVVQAGRLPGSVALGMFAIVMVAATFLVRTVQPIGRSILNMQLCFFPQYIMAFGAGVAAARGGWLLPLARSVLARRAGWAGLVLGPAALAGVLAAGGVFSGRGTDSITGGWHLAALGLAAWEQLTGLCLGLGALAFCSGRLNMATPLSRWLSDRSFGVYLFHPPVLILFTLALRRLDADPFFMVSILTAAGLAGSFLVSDVARRIPGLRAVL
jgi:peptidoglycan/LPS O-acetylase OafA/YrhL